MLARPNRPHPLSVVDGMLPQVMAFGWTSAVGDVFGFAKQVDGLTMAIEWTAPGGSSLELNRRASCVA